MPGRNDKCPCGSGLKYKRCCALLRPPKGGVLRKAFDVSAERPFAVRMLMQIAAIRNYVYPEPERVREFDKYHATVFDNLEEARLVQDRCLELVRTHKDAIAKGVGCEHLPETDQININEPVDTDLNLLFKDFFIRGNIALKGLISLAKHMGFRINFIFKEEKPFQIGKLEFLKENPGVQMQTFVEGIEAHRKNWLGLFVKFRIAIEHRGFRYPRLNYGLTPVNGVRPIFPLFNGQSTEEILKICWGNLESFCEDVIVFLLSQKLPDGLVVYEIPEEKRDRAMPVKYKVNLSPEAMTKLQKATKASGGQ